MNPAVMYEVSETSVSDQGILRNQLGSPIMPREKNSPTGSETRRAVTMNALQRLIRTRMTEQNMTFRDVGTRGGLAWTTVSTLAGKKIHKQVPRRGTLEKLAKGLDVPLDVVYTAAVEAAGLSLQEVPLGSNINDLGAAEDLRIIAAVVGELSAADRAKLRRLALAFSEELRAENEERESGG